MWGALWDGDGVSCGGSDGGGGIREMAYSSTRMAESRSDLMTFFFLIKGCGVIDSRPPACDVAAVLK